MIQHEELQSRLAQMLFTFTDFCDAHGIYYSLSDGTLLGAIRHQGFIPWDDDVDLYIPRPDYDRLLAMEPELKAETGFSLFNAHNRKLPLPFSKVIDQSIGVCERLWADSYAPVGLWLDVFPVDGVPESAEELERFYADRNKYLRLIGIATLKYSGSEHNLKGRIKKRAKEFVGLRIDPYALSLRIEKDARSWDFASAENVAHLVHESTCRKSINKKDFLRGEPVLFEGRLLNAMSCWDDMLAKQYGDYMQLPPEDQRLFHPLEERPIP